MGLRSKKNRLKITEPKETLSATGNISIRVFSYNNTEVSEHSFSDFEPLHKYLEKEKEMEHWVDIAGKTNREFYTKFALHYKLHELVMEDILSTNQRSKVDELEDCLLLISRMIYFDKNAELINEQVNFLVYRRILFTIQDEWEDCFEKVRDNLRKNRLNLREEASFYLAQMLLGAIIDNYFPTLDIIADRLDILEQDLLQNPTHQTSNSIQEAKRTLIFLRKFIRPERDVINHLLNLDHPFIKNKNKMHLRDIYDQCIQINDTVDSYREIAYSLMDVYLSSISNRTNDVMKVLTVISAIFIPLTFIVGVYGMNFENMPELRTQNGYFAIMIFMFLVAVMQVLYFKRRRWL